MLSVSEELKQCFQQCLQHLNALLKLRELMVRCLCHCLLFIHVKPQENISKHDIIFYKYTSRPDSVTCSHFTFRIFGVVIMMLGLIKITFSTPLHIEKIVLYNFRYFIAALHVIIVLYNIIIFQTNMNDFHIV